MQKRAQYPDGSANEERTCVLDVLAKALSPLGPWLSSSPRSWPPQGKSFSGWAQARALQIVHHLPLVRAVASSLFSQMHQNRVRSVPPSVVPAELKCGPLPPAAVCPLGSLGPQTACLMSSCVFRGHLISCHTGPQFP